MIQVTADDLRKAAERAINGYCCNELANVLKDRLAATPDALPGEFIGPQGREAAEWDLAYEASKRFLHPRLIAANLETNGSWANHWAIPTQAPSRRDFLLKLEEEMRDARN